MKSDCFKNGREEFVMSEIIQTLATVFGEIIKFDHYFYIHKDACSLNIIPDNAGVQILGSKIGRYSS